jgi:hypothetical protein
MTELAQQGANYSFWDKAGRACLYVVESVKGNQLWRHSVYGGKACDKLMLSLARRGHDPMIVEIEGQPVNQDFCEKELVFRQHLGLRI